MKQPADVYTGDLLEAPRRGRPRKPDALTPAERARAYRARKRAAKGEWPDGEPERSLAAGHLGQPVFELLPIALQWSLRGIGINNDSQLSVTSEASLRKINLSPVQARDLVCRAARAIA